MPPTHVESHVGRANPTWEYRAMSERGELERIAWNQDEKQQSYLQSNPEADRRWRLFGWSRSRIHRRSNLPDWTSRHRKKHRPRNDAVRPRRASRKARRPAAQARRISD